MVKTLQRHWLTPDSAPGQVASSRNSFLNNSSSHGFPEAASKTPLLYPNPVLPSMNPHGSPSKRAQTLCPESDQISLIAGYSEERSGLMLFSNFNIVRRSNKLRRALVSLEWSSWAANGTCAMKP